MSVVFCRTLNAKTSNRLPYCSWPDSRLPLQAFIGWDEWDDEPLRLELRHQVKTHLGQGDG